MKAVFRTPWGEDEHVKEFKARLEHDQAEHDDIGITIGDVNKFQFYMEEMYTLGRHSKREMTRWDAKPTGDKTNANAHAYFETLARKSETYNANNDGTTARQGFGAINHTVEVDDEIRDALETVFTDRDEAHSQEQEEHLLQSSLGPNWVAGAVARGRKPGGGRSFLVDGAAGATAGDCIRVVSAASCDAIACKAASVC